MGGRNLPNEIFDQEYPDGTPREFGVAAWNASIALIASSDPNPIRSYLVRRYLTIHEVGGSSAADLGQLAPLAVALVLGGDFVIDDATETVHVHLVWGAPKGRMPKL